MKSLPLDGATLDHHLFTLLLHHRHHHHHHFSTQYVCNIINKFSFQWWLNLLFIKLSINFYWVRLEMKFILTAKFPILPSPLFDRIVFLFNLWSIYLYFIMEKGYVSKSYRFSIRWIEMRGASQVPFGYQWDTQILWGGS